jgi:hypothetical protein
MPAMTEEATQAATAWGCGGAVRPDPVMTGAVGTAGLRWLWGLVAESQRLSVLRDQ